MIKVKLPDGTIYDQDGRIDYLNPSVSANTDTLIIRGKIANPLRSGIDAGRGRRPGTGGWRVRHRAAAGATPIQALAIPQAAVLSDQQGSYVYVVGEGNKAEVRRITLGQASGRCRPCRRG